MFYANLKSEINKVAPYRAMIHLVIMILIEICPGITWTGATPMTEVPVHFEFSSIPSPMGNRENNRKNH